MPWPIVFSDVVTPWGEVIPCRNKVRFSGGLAFIKASNSETEFIIEAEDLAIVAPHRWSENNGYAKCAINRVTHSMQWLLCDGWSKGTPVDHINRIRRDNRRSNLRLSSVADNAHNLSMFKTNSSGYPGVTKHKATGKWHAEMAFERGGERTHLSGGYFDSFHEACKKSQEMRASRGYFTHPIPCQAP